VRWVPLNAFYVSVALAFVLGLMFGRNRGLKSELSAHAEARASADAAAKAESRVAQVVSINERTLSGADGDRSVYYRLDDVALNAGELDHPFRGCTGHAGDSQLDSASAAGVRRVVHPLAHEREGS